MRMPRRIRVSGMARRTLIRSRSVAGACVSSTGKRRSHQRHRKLKAQARALGANFKSALVPHDNHFIAPFSGIGLRWRRGRSTPGCRAGQRSRGCRSRCRRWMRVRNAQVRLTVSRMIVVQPSASMLYQVAFIGLACELRRTLRR